MVCDLSSLEYNLISELISINSENFKEYSKSITISHLLRTRLELSFGSYFTLSTNKV